jgi:hypothetical protein
MRKYFREYNNYEYFMQREKNISNNIRFDDVSFEVCKTFLTDVLF